MVVIFSRFKDTYTVITVYPSRNFDSEADRKVKSERWVIRTE
jgi:hypothetical protein